MVKHLAQRIAAAFLIVTVGLMLVKPVFVEALTNEQQFNTPQQELALWNLTIDLQIDSIDMKTEKLFTSRFGLGFWSFENATPVRGVMLKSDKGGSFGYSTDFFDNSSRQRIFFDVATDPTKVQPWDWKIYPQNRLLGLSSPFDSYSLSVFIAVNETLNLLSNSTYFRLPETLQGEWTYSDQLQRLSVQPSYATLASLGFNTKPLADWRGLEGEKLQDFYLYTVTLTPVPTYVQRMAVAFLLPPIIILLLLIVVAIRYSKLSRSDLFAVYLGTAFFILPFLVSFYQFAPPIAFTWQELLFLFDFLFSTALIAYAILKKPSEKVQSQSSKRKWKIEDTTIGNDR